MARGHLKRVRNWRYTAGMLGSVSEGSYSVEAFGISEGV